MNDLNYYYHLTSKPLALLIKDNGMKSQVMRTGSNRAHPAGSFAKDRQKREMGRVVGELSTYVKRIILSGYTENQISENKGQAYLPMQFTLIGENLTDVPLVESKREEKIKQYYAWLPKLPLKKKKWIQPVLTRKPKTREELALMKQRKEAETERYNAFVLSILTDKCHCLGNLARDYISARYTIEELITTSHIYFAKPEYAEDAYTTYKQHIAGEQVMLRVKKEHVVNSEDDDSDYRAVMTKNSVAPEYLEVMTQASNMIGMNNRCDPSNWMPLSDLI